MQVQINTNQRFYYLETSTIEPLKMRGDVTVVVDPGKTNMAMVVGSPAGAIYAILQFSSPGSKNDTSVYCQEFKRFMRQYLSNVTLYEAGIEAAISKKGMNHHHSSMVLTEIRGQLIDLFMHDFGKRPDELNNWAWKSYVLPEGYRSQTEKGSARYLFDYYTIYGNADVTDALCMFTYQTRGSRNTYTIECDSKELPVAPYKVAIYPPAILNGKLRRFVYNRDLSIEDNATFYANRALDMGVAEVPLECLSIDSIYKYAVGFSLPVTVDKVGVVVTRLSNSG